VGQAVVVLVANHLAVLVMLAVLAQFMAVAVVAVLVLVPQHQALVVLAVVAVLKFTHGDLYEQICTYKQSKHC
jgi:hypothetical protein